MLSDMRCFSERDRDKEKEIDGERERDIQMERDDAEQLSKIFPRKVPIKIKTKKCKTKKA